LKNETPEDRKRQELEDINTRTEKVRRFIAVEKNKEINRTWNDTLKGLDESKRRLEEELKKYRRIFFCSAFN